MGDSAESSSDEIERNVFFRAIQPGAILYNCVVKGSLDALCVPQQSFFDASGFSPYLLLTVSSLSGQKDEISPTAPQLSNQDIVTPEQYARVARVLREQFLDYHIVRFDSVASPIFVTARGHRGEFSSDLQKVSRYGCIGTSKVLFDVDYPAHCDNSLAAGPYPCKLHIFVISKPLMDEQEIHNTLSLLQLALVLPKEFLDKNTNNNSNSPCCPSNNVVKAAPKKSVTERLFSHEDIDLYQSIVVDDNNAQFTEFWKIMELPECKPVAETLFNFVEDVQLRETPLFDSSCVQKLTLHCLDKCRALPFFLGNPEKLHVVEEGIEKYIMTKLYSQTFGVVPKEVECDAELTTKLLCFSSRVSAEHLEVNGEVERHHLWGQAMFELDGINLFKSPREKLRCAIRAWRQVSEALAAVLAQKRKKRVCSVEEEKSEGRNNLTLGADELLPCFFLLVLRACPRNYYLNVQYIKRFCAAEAMSFEESYCLANLESAAAFWLSHGDLPAPAEGGTSLIFAPAVEEGLVDVCGLQSTPSSRGAFSPKDVFPGSGPSTKKERGCIDVAKLLVAEEKSFDDLTVAELRAIVEEARQLLAEKQRERGS